MSKVEKTMAVLLTVELIFSVATFIVMLVK